MTVMMISVTPDIPNKKREYRFGKTRQEINKIKNGMVVKSCCYTHIVQPLRITLQVFDRISVSVKDVRII